MAQKTTKRIGPPPALLVGYPPEGPIRVHIDEIAKIPNTYVLSSDFPPSILRSHELNCQTGS